jgi:DNA polymerase-3 subunit alpha
LQIRRVTDVFYNGYKPVFRLTTALGYTIIATANHPFRTTDGWHQLDELQPGRQIAAVGQFPVNLADTAILWDTIQSISPADSADTYDLTVEHDHNFVANGLIAHNSHSAAYGLIAYQNAWLKAHYRCEYMAALLTADSGNSDKILIYLNDCAKYNVEVLPPNINQSQKSFSVVDGKIRFGLSGVKNVGEGAIDAIIEARDLGGHFKSLVDFCERIDLKRVNRRVIESLIKCGAFDNPKITRAAMFEAIEEAIAHGQHFQKEKDSAQFSLFGEAITSTSTYHIPPRAEWLDKEKLACEKNVLGFYISGHPLDRYRADLGNFVSSEIAELHERKNGGIVSIAGIVTSRKDMTTKRGDRMAFVVIEDLTGTIEVSLFPDVFREAAPLLDADQPLLIKGDLECGEQSVKIAAKEVSALSEIRAQRTKEIHLKFKSDQLAKPKFDAMLQTLSKHPGKCTTFIHIEIPSRSHTTIRLPDNIKLTPSETLLEELEIIFGSNPVFMK